MSRSGGDPAEIRARLLRLLHAAANHCDLRSPAELLMLAETYSCILYPDQQRPGRAIQPGGQ